MMEKLIHPYQILPVCSGVVVMFGTLLISTFCWIAGASGLIKLTKSEGESWQLCLVPLCRLKLCTN